jgi:predicted nucleic acid-binding protein
MVLVDSSIWIEAARRNGDLASKVGLEGLLEEFEAALCGPARLEVLGGARRNDRENLEAYFDGLPSIPLEEADWKAAVRNGWLLRDAGYAVPWNDILIATLSIRAGCRVYARDAHFDSMKSILGIRLYEPGPGGSYSPDVA